MVQTRRERTFQPKRTDISWRRTISNDVKIMLAVRTAGRCQFRDCNRFLFRHPINGLAGNFAEFAHIIGFRPDGPRGRSVKRPRDINGISNLMLLCQSCHKLIDDREDLYPVYTLKDYKRLHEQRIRLLTESKKTNITSVVTLTGRIRGQDVEILDSDIDEALFPRFSEKGRDCNIDLRSLGDLNPENMKSAAAAITSNLQRLYGLGFSGGQVGHVSVFAYAPIPLLVHLGAQISNKVTTDFFQRHRSTESWKWKNGNGRLIFSTKLQKRGSDLAKAALIISISGKIFPKDLPERILKSHYIYEISAGPKIPQADLLKTRADLDRFRQSYEAWQGNLLQRHQGRVGNVDIFAAVPIPVAMMLGFARLPKIAPALRIYENEPHDGGFKMALEVK